jgi:choline kinase
MKAIMLAAGRGSRLAGDDPDHPPKSLLKFGGKTLLERHVEILKAEGVLSLALVVGYRARDIRTELKRIGAGSFVETIDNPDFHQGTTVSLWCARDVLVSGETVLFMDADVLYHPDLLRRLTKAPQGDRMLLDRDFGDGDEPVKLCVDQGRVVEFRKGALADADLVGEWPGFLTLTPTTARVVAEILNEFVAGGRRAAPMEDVIREVALNRCPDAFAIEDITGLPWIEIDFPEDVARAEKEILPLLP